MNFRKAMLAAIGATVMLGALLTTGPVAAHSGMTCVRIKWNSQAYKSFSLDTFHDNNADGVPDAFTAWSDYWLANNSNDHCDRRVYTTNAKYSGDNVVHQEIYGHSDHNNGSTGSGDVSIVRTFAATAGESFTASAWANLWAYSGDFRGRLKLVALDANGNQIAPEFNRDICTSAAPTADFENGRAADGGPLCEVTDNGNYQKITVTTAPLKSGTKYVNLVFRAREHRTNSAYGVAGLDKISFSKI